MNFTGLTGVQAEVFSLLNFSSTPLFPLNLAPTATTSLLLQCQPTTLGQFTAKLELTSNNPHQPALGYPLICTSQALPKYTSHPLPSGRWEFGSDPVGNSLIHQFPLSNEGDTELHVHLQGFEGYLL